MFKKLFFSILLSIFAFSSNAQSIGLIGDFNSFSADVVMATTDSQTYTLTAFALPAAGTVKFRQDGAWSINWGNPTPTNTSGTISGIGTQGGNNIPLPAATYNITFNRLTGAFTFTPLVLGFDDFGFNGGFNSYGSSLSMFTSDGISYSKKEHEFTAVGAKFNKINTPVASYGGTAPLVGTAVLNASAIPVPLGFYDVNFNKNTLAYSFIEVPVSLMGSGANGWTATSDIYMTSTDGGINFTLTGQTLTLGEVKFRSNTSWAKNWGTTTPTITPGSITGIGILEGNPGNGNIPVTPGVYDITFNRVTGAFTFTQIGGPVYDSVGITGAFNTAATSVLLTTADGISYSKKDVNYSAANVKFIKSNDLARTYGGPGWPTGTAVLNGVDIPLVPGYYNVTYDNSNGAYAFAVATIGIVGDFTSWGGNPDFPMVTADNGYTFTAANVVIPAVGGAKFRSNGEWTNAYGGDIWPSSATGTGGNIPVVAGTYNVSFNRLTGAYNFQNALSTSNFSKNGFELYPNPTNDSFKLNTFVSNVEVYNITGQVVKSFKGNFEANALFSVNELNAGVYLVKITDEQNRVSTTKLIKE
jgi:starch-binding outer membrane protein SusE/F